MIQPYPNLGDCVPTVARTRAEALSTETGGVADTIHGLPRVADQHILFGRASRPGLARRPRTVAILVVRAHLHLVGGVGGQVVDTCVRADHVLGTFSPGSGVAHAVAQVVAINARAPRVRRRRPAHVQACRAPRGRGHCRRIRCQRRFVQVGDVVGDGHSGLEGGSRLDDIGERHSDGDLHALSVNGTVVVGCQEGEGFLRFSGVEGETCGYSGVVGVGCIALLLCGQRYLHCVQGVGVQGHLDRDVAALVHGVGVQFEVHGPPAGLDFDAGLCVPDICVAIGGHPLVRKGYGRCARTVVGLYEYVPDPT